MVQSLPTYAMSVFLLPVGMCNDLERMMTRFWWSSKDTQGKVIIWKSWDRMVSHNAVGGMSFMNLRDFNLSMLGK